MTLTPIFALTQLLHLIAAVASLALAGWLLPRGRERGPAITAAAIALVLSSAWALSVVGLGIMAPVTGGLLSLSYLAWLWMLYRLFAHDERDKSVRPIRPVIFALAFVEMLRLALIVGQAQYAGVVPAEALILRFSVTFRLLFCVGALVLVHNLYAGASAQAREALRWPAAALAAIWLYDLNLSTVAYLGGEIPLTLTAFRAAALLVCVGLLAGGLIRKSGSLRFSPSRSFAFQSFSLLVIGAYLMIMVLVAQGLAYVGSDLARFVQLGFLVMATAAILTILPSRRLRGWLRVTLSKHLFQHRYDYRTEWLRFTDTIGRAAPTAAPLRERVVQSVADITDSPCGLLLTPREDGGLGLDARWQWPAIEVPAEAIEAEGASFFENSQFILDLDDLRAGRLTGVPDAASPAWLMEEQSVWALVPLLHFERLVGVVVLARPPVTRRLDWEDFDLLRVVGRQLASYLAEQGSQDALGEAQRFDEFNRRIAFVMHDIKNLASQLSLLASNAEKHADKPEFRADMLVTLRNSSDKLQALLARLGRYGRQGGEARVEIPVERLLADVAARFANRSQVVQVKREPCTIVGDREALEQALVHLVQNAIDASEDTSPVFLDIRREATDAVIEIVDSGCGMSPEFVRTRLFKPFHSSKPSGFGIGAFEARELIRAMGGTLDVESREGLGTRFLVHLPLAGMEALKRSIMNKDSEVA
ncbi:C4-dicarboxylate transport sensor protein DctB [Croceibacterium atlanticum]|uniref:histidine kinase n=1 Tax=Croceibacterium atlanticum TaxID=1267766 RepID=A0A0F7KQR4_9SPHN|nr:XrtA/PEP-CTERM system histidine kinase PrsK [Croceibacterium atlanticum]AKH41431.1 C4-dicarboxylate transport sensor protein DctB [Croceibacterium atlanticum]